jgi:glycine/D-amino acid oxidase-like deaminating enzyme
LNGVIVAEVRDAEITIVGGGAIGCAVAYCLACAGYPDIQILERGELAAATSSQAAGLVGQVRGSQERTRLAMASVALYSKIEQETGYTADWRQTGSIRIAMSTERVEEFRVMAGVAASAGLAGSVLESLRPDPSPYIRSLSPARFMPRDWTWESARDRAELIYETYYGLAAAAQGGR